MLYLNANYLTNLGMMYVHVEENTCFMIQGQECNLEDL